MITWYRRPPMIPKGTAQMAMSAIVSFLPPRAAQRRAPSHTATKTPRMMQKAYALSGTGPRYRTPVEGLGSAASSIPAL
ncbi:hypothetical protein GCM10018771_70120 [Streptomyces cellulosae]|nr:hypothetical protein GCM10018771_70120 [Streptomyces cellulosae]